MSSLPTFLFLQVMIFCQLSHAISYEEALANARANLYDASKMLPEAVRALEQYQGAYQDPSLSEWIEVYLYNRRGQLIPQRVKRDVWNRTRGECPAGQAHPIRPDQMAMIDQRRYAEFDATKNCIRSVQTYPQMACADCLQWNRQADGTVAMMRCPQATLESCHWPIKETDQLTCRDNDLLPNGMKLENVRKSGFDCRQSAVRNNDFLALACNIYFESGNQGTIGKAAVGEVTMNRTRANNLRNENRSDQCGPNYAKTVRAVVFEQRWNSRTNRCVPQFSWTTSPAVVNFTESPTDINRAAWHEALYQAMMKYNVDDRGVPLESSDPLGCYTHYLSLRSYPTYDDMLVWAKTYINDSMTMASNIRPICVGDHIFFRNTDNEFPCDPPTIFHDPEAGDKEITLRTTFFETCMKVPVSFGTPDPTLTQRKICEHNTLEQVICDQVKENPGLTIGGQPISACAADGSLILPASHQ